MRPRKAWLQRLVDVESAAAVATWSPAAFSWPRRRILHHWVWPQTLEGRCNPKAQLVGVAHASQDMVK